MALLKKKSDIDGMCIVGQKLNSIFSQIIFDDLIGKSTFEVDVLIEQFLKREGLTSCAKGYKGYPSYACISINDVLVHGVPNRHLIIKSDDLVKIDMCVSYNGFCADACRLYTNNKANLVYTNMMQCGIESLNAGIAQCRPGNTIGDIALAIENVIKCFGYAIVTDFAGHGIGKRMHEDPIVPNYFDQNDLAAMKQKIYPGMAFAIEPMFCQWSADLIIDKHDSWTVRTIDKGMTMHIEDTVVVEPNKTIITTRL